MKKKFAKKLALNKKTISVLNKEELKNIRGASIVYACTRSCTIVYVCCDPKTDQQEALLKGLDLG